MSGIIPSTMIPRLPINFRWPIWRAIARPSRVSQPPTQPGHLIRRLKRSSKTSGIARIPFEAGAVSVQGHVARIFRQGPVGSFPALAEVWITSPAGDPFCVVFPQPGPTAFDDPLERHSDAGRGIAMPEIGQMVRFTGTFLKMVRYAGSDGPRLAPLIVGGQQPVPVAPRRRRPFSRGNRRPWNRWRQTFRNGASASLLGTWAGDAGRGRRDPGPMAFAYAGTARRGRKMSSRSIPDPPLEFIEPRDQP